MEPIIGNRFLLRSEIIEITPLKTNKVVCLYFSAAWCPPCQGFTPILIDFYNEVNVEEKQLEIILITRDSSKEEFEEFFAQMPWIAIPYDDPRIKTLTEIHNIKGLPSLLVLKKNGEIATRTGKVDVVNDGIDAFKKWLEMI